MKLETTLLTPAEVLAHFRRERHWLKTAVRLRLIEAVNISGVDGHGARYRYRLKPLEAETPPLTPEEAHWQELKRRRGW